MKTISALSLLLTLSSSAWAGPRISEGPGPVGNLLHCRGMDNDSSFVIRRTAAITFIQGLYIRSGWEPVSMGCKRSNSGWACSDVGRLGGENKLYARAYRNSQGIITAQLFRNNIMGMPVVEDSLVCQVGD